MFTLFKPAFRVTLLSILLFASATASASGNKSYHVTITNLTNAISFTPILVL